MNLESITSRPDAGGGSKDCVAWKVEKAVHYFILADEVTMDSSTDLGKEPQPLEDCLIYSKRCFYDSPDYSPTFIS